MIDQKKISAIIITYNEEQNIKECLNSIKWCNEIIVIDSFSTDRTVKICKSFPYKVKIIKRKWKGYSEQKNFAAKKAQNDWILSVDADERITLELKKEIQTLLKNNVSSFNGYKIPRKNYYFGQWLKRGGNYPDYQIRLYHRKFAQFKAVLLHEGVQVKDPVGVLCHPMNHFTYQNVDDYFKRFIRYTEIEKNILISKKIKITPLKTFYYVIFVPIKKFISRFIFKGGFLDGFHGFILITLNNITRIIAFYKYYLWKKK